jgi:hypothetical protein
MGERIRARGYTRDEILRCAQNDRDVRLAFLYIGFITALKAFVKMPSIRNKNHHP